VQHQGIMISIHADELSLTSFFFSVCRMSTCE
jgi:hypothetical protein